MTYAYETITLGSDAYPVYATVEMADAYLAGSMSLNASKWRDLTSADDKGRYLIQMTRVLERQRWKGIKTDAGQELAWPRINTGVAGVEDDQIPQQIIDASIEGAAALSNGATFESTQNQSNGIASMSAGSVSMSFFRGAEGSPSRFPLSIQELLRDYLASSGIGVLATVTGTDGVSLTEKDYGLNRGL